MTGVRSLDHPSGRSRLVCEQCDDLAPWIDPIFWQWFHYRGSFESEDSGAPTAPGFPLSNTIVARNTDASGGEAPDCAGTITSTGYNLIGTDGGCTFGATTGDQVGSNVSPLAAGLSGLANNGGTSVTHAPVLGSLVLNAGNPAAPFLPPACLQTDQIGTVRPLNGRCDIGALESNPPPVTGGGTTAAPAAKKKCKKKAKKTAVAAKKCKKKKK